MSPSPVRWTRLQLKNLCNEKQVNSCVRKKTTKTPKKASSARKNQLLTTPFLPLQSTIISPPATEEDAHEVSEAEKWKDYINLFNCDQCARQIHDFRIYCRYCEKSQLDQWSYESYDLCPACFQRSFPKAHPHPRESFSIRHISYFNRDLSNLIPDGYWEGAIIERCESEKKCGFCHQASTKDFPFVDSEKPFLRLRKSESKPCESLDRKSSRDFFHRPYFWAHQICARYSPEAYYSENLELWFNVALALFRGKSIKCSLCRRNGATLGCFEIKCERSYHVPCTGQSLEELVAGTIYWCPSHDLIARGQAEYLDHWSCDQCLEALQPGAQVFSCGKCSDYYNSFDLCSTCFLKNFPYSHMHGKDDFVIRKIDALQTDCAFPGQFSSDSSKIDRSKGPAPEDLYSMDFSSTFLDIHNRAPRWATHNSTDFAGTWIPQIPRWSLLKYTKSGETVLANFLGRGTDAIECLLLGRRVIGIDVNRQHLATSIQNCTALGLGSATAEIQLGDATDLGSLGLGENTIDLVLSHPPYYKCIQYSFGNEAVGDMSRCESLVEFRSAIFKAAKESFRVLRVGGSAVLGIGDNRESRYLQPVTLVTIQAYIEAGFQMDEFMVKRQRCCSGTTKGSALSTMFGFLLLTHEIIVVFKKSKLQRRLAAEPPKAANWINKSVPCRTEGVDRRYSHGTIWTVPDGALGDASTYINEQFTYLYGVRGTSCKIIKSRLSFLPEWLPNGPFSPCTKGDTPVEEPVISEYERERRKKIGENRSWMASQQDSLSDLGASDCSPVHSMLIIEPGVELTREALQNTTKDLPRGSHLIIGTRDTRVESYRSCLLETWEMIRGMQSVVLKEIVYVVPPGWTRSQKLSKPPETSVAEWTPVLLPLSIVHLAYLVYRMN